MGITPKTDLVLSVSLAADPLKYQEAVGRLRQISSDESFSAMLADQGDAPASDVTASNGPEDALKGGPAVMPGAKDATTPSKSAGSDVYSKLEAFIMQTFIQSMLPKDATSVYGKGTAGDVWKSMLSEKMGTEVAKSGKLGIATRLAQAGITTGSIARTAPSAAPAPMSATLSSLSGKDLPPTAKFARALTALQEANAVVPTASPASAVATAAAATTTVASAATTAATTAVASVPKTLGAWVTTVKRS